MIFLKAFVDQQHPPLSDWMYIFPANIIFWIFKIKLNKLPDGCVFLSKWAFNNSKACGVNDVLLFRFFDGSTPMKSVRWFCPDLYLCQWLNETKKCIIILFLKFIKKENLIRKTTFLQLLSSIAPIRVLFFVHFLV